MKTRTIKKIIKAQATLEGGGFLVHRPFPTQQLMDYDPFLLLDEMGPSEHGPGEAQGAPDHPHRGFETVTYLLSGGMEHKDSRGNHGTLNAGDVQWMTAGAGVVHSEMPTEEFQKKGGRMHGFQLWVNLPSREKMRKPRYQDLKSEKIPTWKSPDGKVTAKVIAGQAGDVRATTETLVPIHYVHYRLAPGASVEHRLPSSFNALAYRIEAHEMIQFDRDGDSLRLENTTDREQNVLLIAGEPIGEKVVRYGPFVMNSLAELEQAFEDYRSGKMGEIDF